jgi:peroxidase
LNIYKSNGDYYDQIGRGCIFDQMNEDDRHVGNALLDHLFETSAQPREDSFFRLSLPALNIERGRDHGIRGYVYYKDKYAGTVTRKFEDLKDVMSEANYKKLSEVYKNVEDVDLFTGGLAETSIQNAGSTRTASVGVTFASKFNSFISVFLFLYN